jgi:ankyrin repeat protein
MTLFGDAKKAIVKDNAWELAKILQKLDPNIKEAKTGKSLIWACFTTQRCNKLCLSILKNCGCTIDDRDIHQQTILNYACESNYETVVENCLQHSPDVNAQDWGGYTPLYYAVWNCNEKIVKMLLEAGADPKITNKWGKNCWYPLLSKNVSQFADKTRMQDLWNLLIPHLDTTVKAQLDEDFKEIKK